MNGKQRSALKKLSHGIPVTLTLGKEGITDSFLAELETQLESHELVKIHILPSSELETKETANELCQQVRAEFVQSIGHKAVIYRRSHTIDPRKRIQI